MSFYEFFSKIKSTVLNFLFYSVGRKKSQIHKNNPLKQKELIKSIPNIIDSPHNCSLIALHLTLSKIPESKILDAFYHCCEDWPNGGVTNKEFNIVIKFLKIDSLVYCDRETTIDSLLSKKKNFIALVYGHYLAISKNCILEYYNPYWHNNTNEKVYCYWEYKGM